MGNNNGPCLDISTIIQIMNGYECNGITISWVERWNVPFNEAQPSWMEQVQSFNEWNSCTIARIKTIHYLFYTTPFLRKLPLGWGTEVGNPKHTFQKSKLDQATITHRVWAPCNLPLPRKDPHPGVPHPTPGVPNPHPGLPNPPPGTRPPPWRMRMP